MACKKFDLAWISVSDVERSKKFFTDILGMEIASEAPEFDWAEMSAPDGGARLGIGKANPQDPTFKAGSNAIPTLTVDDIEKSKADIEAKGVKLIGDTMEVPGYVKLQTFADPDGNLYQLVQLLSDK